MSSGASAERKMAVNKLPFGRHHLQSLGQTRRVFKGEGEFVGQGAYDTFGALASVFYQETPGPLIHPVWMAVTAWFVGLELLQEPRSDYVRYSFEFWEVVTGVTAEMTSLPAGESSPPDRRPAAWYTVARGDTLWAVASRFDTTVEALLAANPSIRNPNLILVGQKVRLP